MRAILFAAFLAVVNCLALSDSSVKLLNPAGFETRHGEYASVVFGVDTVRIEKVTVNAKNVSYDMTIKSGRDIYCKTVPLAAGENNISITVYEKNGSINVVSANVYHDLQTDKAYKFPPQPYGNSPFHTSENEKICGRCHKMQPNEQVGKAFDDVKQSNCYECHKKVASAKEGHAPTINWMCTSCHESKEPSGRVKSRFGAPNRIGQNCFGCHEQERAAWEEKRFRHMPVEAQQCSRCHNPHSSENRSYLRAKTWELCTSCHADKISGSHILNTIVSKMHPTQGRPDPSRPGKQLECISCHDPHASDTRSMLKGKSPMSICIKCHKK